MTSATLVERNTSEKGRRGAMAAKAAIAERKEAEEKRAIASKKPKTAHISEVPPYCYRQPGMSADEAAVATVREMRISHPCDALALLWELRRAAQIDAAEVVEPKPSPQTKKCDSANFHNLPAANTSGNSNHEVSA